MALFAAFAASAAFADRSQCSPSSADDIATETLEASTKLVSQCEAFAMTMKAKCQVDRDERDVNFAQVNRLWKHCLVQYDDGRTRCGIEGIKLVRAYESLQSQATNPRFCELQDKVKRIGENLRLAQYAAGEAGRTFDQRKIQFADLLAKKRP